MDTARCHMPQAAQSWPLTLSNPAMVRLSAKNSAGLFCCSTSALPLPTILPHCHLGPSPLACVTPRRRRNQRRCCPDASLPTLMRSAPVGPPLFWNNAASSGLIEDPWRL